MGLIITAVAFTATLIPTIVGIIMAPPIQIKNWSPFKIDALGIITLLGADAIRKSLGRLVYSPFEYCPLLAGHIFADNSVMEPVTGFVLYNTTEGVKATDLNAWFTRWLLCQKVTYNSTRLEIQAVRYVPGLESKQCLAIGLAAVLNAFIWPMLMEDWYGFAASLSLVTLVVIRACILFDFRGSINKGVDCADTATKKKEVKLFITLPDGNRLTAITTTGIAQDCLLTQARPSSERVHIVGRAVCWLAFGIHAVTLGMACLAVQFLLIILTLGFSVAMIMGWLSEGSNSSDTCIGNRLIINQRNDGVFGSMASVYALLDLTEEEEQNMIAWSLFPTQHNKLWLPTYRKFRNDAIRNPTVLRTWGERMRKAHADANAGQQVQ